MTPNSSEGARESQNLTVFYIKYFSYPFQQELNFICLC